MARAPVAGGRVNASRCARTARLLTPHLTCVVENARRDGSAPVGDEGFEVHVVLLCRLETPTRVASDAWRGRPCARRPVTSRQRGRSMRRTRKGRPVEHARHARQGADDRRMRHVREAEPPLRPPRPPCNRLRNCLLEVHGNDDRVEAAYRRSDLFDRRRVYRGLGRLRRPPFDALLRFRRAAVTEAWRQVRSGLARTPPNRYRGVDRRRDRA